MSIAITIGDVIAISSQAYNLFKQCSKVAHGAPQGFTSLIAELGRLNSMFSMLKEEVEDPESTLVRSGKDKVRMVKETMDRVEKTLEELEQFSKKYEKPLKLSKGPREKIKHMWDSIKWSLDVGEVDSLRNRLNSHNVVINWLLTSAGNSSLQRLELSHQKVEQKVNEIGEIIHKLESRNSPVKGKQELPVLSALKGDQGLSKYRFSAILMENAEIYQPWNTIGIHDWIKAGSWWLLKYQTEMYGKDSPKDMVSKAAYAMLLKASWILRDVIARHSQLNLLRATIRFQVEGLTEAIFEEFKKIDDKGLDTPSLQDLEPLQLHIWEKEAIEDRAQHGAIPSHVDTIPFQVSGLLAHHGVENYLLIFKRLGNYQHPTGRRIPCLILFTVHKHDQDARLSVYDQNMWTQAEISVNPSTRGTCHCDHQSIVIDGTVVTGDFEDHWMLYCLICAWVEYTWWYRSSKTTPKTVSNPYLVRAFVTIFASIFDHTNFIDIWSPAENYFGALGCDKKDDRLGLFLGARQLKRRLTGLKDKVKEELRKGKEVLFPCMERKRVDQLAMRLVYAKAELSDLPDNGWRKFVHSFEDWNDILADFFQHWKVSNTDEPETPHAYLYWEYLLMASEAGNRAVVYTLLQSGVQPDDPSPPTWQRQKTPLQAAAAGGYDEVVTKLLDAGADANAVSVNFRSALKAAVEGGYKEVVQKLVQAGAVVNTQLGMFNERTALQAAAEKGYSAIVRILLDAGADVNAGPAAISGRTALQAAAGLGSAELVELLLRAGADINAKLAWKEGRTALQAGAEAGSEEVVKILLIAGADVNALPAESLGRTALQAAAQGGFVEIARLLIQANVDVNAAAGKRNGMTALQAAAFRGHEAVVEILLEAGANVNAEPASEEGLTALQAAASGGHYTLVMKFIRLGVHPDEEPSRNGRTALQAAAGNGHDEIVKLLVEAGANINAPAANQGGRTALQAAAEGGHESTVKMLLTYGSKVNEEPVLPFGITALQVAAIKGNIRIVKMLLDAGADVNASTILNVSYPRLGDRIKGFSYRKEMTALQAAQAAGHTEIIELLVSLVERENLVQPEVSNLLEIC